MDKIINITNTKENLIEFDVTVQGIKTDDLTVKLVLEAGKFEVCFPAENVGGEKFRVSIPPIPFIEKTMFPFHVCVVCDGFYFEPFKGQANIVGSADIYVSLGDTKTVSPSKDIEVKTVTPSVVPPSVTVPAAPAPEINVVSATPTPKPLSLDTIRAYAGLDKMESKKPEKKPEEKIITETKEKAPETKKVNDADVKELLENLKPSAKTPKKKVIREY